MIADVEVATGQIVCLSIGDTRTEADIVVHLRSTLATDMKSSNPNASAT